MPNKSKKITKKKKIGLVLKQLKLKLKMARTKGCKIDNINILQKKRVKSSSPNQILYVKNL